MRLFLALTIYRLILPLLFIAAFPGWVVKMLKRGGIGTRLGERAAIYTTGLDFETCGAVHFHAISVGESMLALKLIREWQIDEPDRRFVLATGTATGHAIANAANIPGLCVTYSPLDFPSMVNRYLNRFEPSQIVLIEAEVWPNLLLACRRRKIPVRLVNARLSPRSARRFRRFAKWVGPVFRMLDAVAIQEKNDADVWQTLGIPPEKIHATGSLKFDPGSGPRPTRRPDFQKVIDPFGPGRPVVLAASTHIGEEAFIARAIRAAHPEALPLIVPRHAERRAEVKSDLEREGFEVILRTDFHPPANPLAACLVIDTTGELRDWTAHADAVIIGKSFLSTGGQNPAEAILAHKPVIFGPHMENFEPLASHLVSTGASLQVADESGLKNAIIEALDPTISQRLTDLAAGALSGHDGATRRILSILSGKKV
jgi:3-deoxy-D-manno-octulosonic-acid transferase